MGTMILWLALSVCPAVEAAASAAAAATSSPARHTVSGFSSGASLALLHFVAHSASCRGVGIIGGSPYGCQLMPASQYGCSGYANNSNKRDPTIPWDALRNNTFTPYLHARAAQGLIDPLSSIVNGSGGEPAAHAYLYSGLHDKDVFQEVMQAVRDQLLGPDELAMAPESVRVVFDVPSAHAFVVDDETCAAPGATRPRHCCGQKNAQTQCTVAPVQNVSRGVGCCGHCNDGGTGGAIEYWKPPINNCGVDVAGDMLSWLEPPLVPLLPGAGATTEKPARGRAVVSNLLSFAQQRYMPDGFSCIDAGFAAVGFVYVPTRCRNSPVALASCSLHVHYHPCGGNHAFLNTSYMLETGMAAWAELHKMVVLHPQANTARPGDEDPGCWDWYGGINELFDTQKGVQISATMSMLADLPAIVANATASSTFSRHESWPSLPHVELAKR